MRSCSWLPFVSLLMLAAGLLAAACGCSGDERGPPDMGSVLTATPPDPLPEVIIVGDVTPAPQGGTTYTVLAGDTLDVIAERFGTTAEVIAEANGIEDPAQLEVGQVLVIPGGSRGDETEEQTTPDNTGSPSPTPGASSQGECTYTVQSGDVAHNIAQQYGLSDEEFAALNGTTIEDMRDLTVGDVLAVPCEGSAGTSVQ